MTSFTEITCFVLALHLDIWEHGAGLLSNRGVSQIFMWPFNCKSKQKAGSSDTAHSGSKTIENSALEVAFLRHGMERTEDSAIAVGKALNAATYLVPVVGDKLIVSSGKPPSATIEAGSVIEFMVCQNTSGERFIHGLFFRRISGPYSKSMSNFTIRPRLAGSCKCRKRHAIYFEHTQNAGYRSGWGEWRSEIKEELSTLGRRGGHSRSYSPQPLRCAHND